MHGSSNENGFLIDGMDVSNLDGNGTGAIMYLDPYAFQETNYQTGGAGTAISSKGGLLFNMITRTGTNQFHGGGMFTGANHAMGSANYSDELRAQLLAAVPPAALAANPEHRARRGHPEDLRRRRLAGGTDRARQALVLGLGARSARSISTCSATTTPTARRCSTTT